MYYTTSFTNQLDVDYISHHGIKGMKWGVRRYQNYDGTRTAKGKVQDRKNSKKRMSNSVKNGLKTAAKIAGAAALVGGTVAVANAIGSSSGDSTHSYSKSNYSNKRRNDSYTSGAKEWYDNYSKQQKASQDAESKRRSAQDAKHEKYWKESAERDKKWNEEYKRNKKASEDDARERWNNAWDNARNYKRAEREYYKNYERQRNAKQAADEGSVKSKQHYESTGKKVYDNLVGKYGKTKARDVAKQDFEAAQKRVKDAMKKASEEEHNGGRTAATMNEVRKAREARKAAQAVYEQFNTDEQPKQNSSTTTKKSNTSTTTQRKTTSTPKSSTTRKTNTSNKNRQSIRYLQAAS